MTKAAVLGGGHAGQAMAAELSVHGDSVRLYQHPDFVDTIKPVIESGRIRFDGCGPGGSGEATVELATTDLAEAVQDVNVIHVVIPSFAQETLFKPLSSLLQPDQLVVVWAGNLGSLLLPRLFQERNAQPPTVAETCTMPFAVRMTGPGSVHFFLRASKIIAAAVPAAQNQVVVSHLAARWPAISPASNVLGVVLSNVNATVHVPGALLNLGMVEGEADFRFFGGALTPAVGRVVRAVWDETAAIGSAYGVHVITYDQEDFSRPGSLVAAGFDADRDALQGIVGLLGPKALTHRYFTEDVPYGLVLWSDLAARALVAAPVINALVDLASAASGSEFRREGRTLDSLGLSGCNADGVRRIAERGFSE